MTDSGPVVAPQPAAGMSRAALVATALVAGVALVLAAWGWLRPAPEAAPGFATRLSIDLSWIDLGNFDQMVVSPDGSRFAVTGSVDDERALYWRSANDENFRLVPGTEYAQGASFSPDGDWITYGTTRGELYKVSLAGGAPTLLVRSGSSPQGVYQPHWGDDHTIAFFNPGGSYRIPDNGGEFEQIPGLESAIHAQILPGGVGVVASRLSETGGIVLASAGADSVRELSPTGFAPKYVETGHILYVDASGGLWALPFDIGSGEVRGEAIPVLDGVSGWVLGIYRAPRFSVSRNGTLTYGVGGAIGSGESRLVMATLDGDLEPLDLSPRNIGSVRLSPDGGSVVYTSAADGDIDADVYLYDMELGTTPRQLSFVGANRNAAISPDGTRIAFSSLREGTDVFDLFVKALGDDAPATSLATLAGSDVLASWVSDDVIAFEHGSPSDLWTLDISDPDDPVAGEYLAGEAELSDLQVSRDGALAAYASNETGRLQVYIRSFPEPGERTPVSQDYGRMPRWAPDGSSVYYWAWTGEGGDYTLWSARIRRDPAIVVARDSLFTTSIQPGETWDLAPDGNHLLFTQTVAASADADGRAIGGEAQPERFLVVTNWFQELRERVEGGR